jgi:hypothetical protein
LPKCGDDGPESSGAVGIERERFEVGLGALYVPLADGALGLVVSDLEQTGPRVPPVVLFSCVTGLLDRGQMRRERRRSR